MLVTIHNLPSHARYADIKALLLSKCGFKEVILDNLMSEGTTKKVTVGLAEEEDAAILTRNINGLYMDGQQLYVKDVRATKPAAQQPYYKSNTSDYGKPDQTSVNYQQMSQYQGYPGFPVPGFQASQQPMPPDGMMQMMMNPMMGMYYMPQASNSYMDYSGQGDMAAASQYPGQQDANQGGLGSGSQNDRSQYDGSRNWGSSSSTANRPANNSGDRYKSRWDEPEESSRDGFRSRSPHRSARARDSDRRSPVRAREQYRRSDERRDTDSYGGLGSGSGDNYRGQDRGDRNPQNKPQSDSSSKNKYKWERQASPVLYKNQSQTQGGNRYDSQQANTPGRHGSFENNSQQFNRWGTPNNDKRTNTYESKKLPRVWENQPPVSNENYQSQRGSYSNRSESTFQPSTGRASFGNRSVQMPGPSNARQSFNSYERGNDNAETPRFNKKPIDMDPAAVVRRDTAYRLQAAAEIVKEMLKTIVIDDDVTLKNLKRAVRSRFEILLAAEELGLSQDEMIKKYRAMFAPRHDAYFVEQVTAARRPDLDNRGEAGSSSTMNAPGGSKQNGAVKTPAAPKQQNVQTANKPRPVEKPRTIEKQVQIHAKKGKNPMPTSMADIDIFHLPKLIPPPPTQNLPKFPNADKQIYRTMKIIQEAETESDNFYGKYMEEKFPLEEAALLAEADIICNMFKEELDNPTNDYEKQICEKILEGKTLKDLKKAILLHTSKRILNVPTSLMVRMFSTGRAPRKAPLSAFLAARGVVAMKKSVGRQQLYVLTCDSYRSYDRLCHDKRLEFDENTVLNMRPFQLLGPITSIHERRAQLKQARKDAKLVHKQAMAALNDPTVNLDDSDDDDEDDDDEGLDHQEPDLGHDELDNQGFEDDGNEATGNNYDGENQYDDNAPDQSEEANQDYDNANTTYGDGEMNEGDFEDW